MQSAPGVSCVRTRSPARSRSFINSPGIAIVPLNLARFSCNRLKQEPGRQHVLELSRSPISSTASTCELHERTPRTFSRCFGNSIRLRHKCGSRRLEHGFSDASRRCAVARASEGPDFARLYGHAPIGLAIARNLDFNDSVCKIISQMRSPTDVVRLALSGEEEGKLRFSVAVNGGTAVVTCPVRRVRIENDASPSETREFWFSGDALANAVALPRGGRD